MILAYGSGRASGALSLNGGGIWISSRGGRNLGQIVKELPKVSEVATNHWVFLRCDWSPVSS